MANTFTVATIFTAVDQMTAPVKRMQETVGGLSRAAGSIVGALGVGIGISALFKYGDEVKRIAMEQVSLKTAYNSIFGSQGAAQLQYSADLAKKLGLSYTAVAESYMQISAAARGSAINDSQVKALFLGVSQGATALHLSSDQTKGAMTALQQMISKGKVQAEELRGQLGERLPGAFNIAARAMGMSTQQLDKYMSTGKLTAEEFIPRFAAQMTKEFGSASAEASKSFVSMQNRFDNSVYQMNAAIGSALLPGLGTLYEKLTPIIEAVGPTFVGTLNLLTGAWNSGVLPAILAVTAAVVGMNIVFAIYQGIMVVIPIVVGIVQSAIAAYQLITEGATIAQMALNAAMLFGPQVVIVAIVAGITALIAIILLMINNWDAVVSGFMVGLDFVKKGVLSLLAIAFLPWLVALDGILMALISIGKFAGMDVSGLESFKAGAEKFVMDNTFAGDIAPLSGAAATSQNTTTTNRSQVDVNFNNAPAGTGIRQKGDAPGVNLNMGWAGMGAAQPGAFR